jgi:hypothetical protein
VSDTDSFINEVSEEVRRDALFGYLRRYGWIAIVVVLGLVGGAAYNEYTKAQTQAVAQSIGDQMMDALSQDETIDRATALAAIDAEGPAAAIAALLTAATQHDSDQLEAAALTLNGLAVNPDVPEIYRDLAALKAAMLPSDDVEARLAALETLAQPGSAFALLAREQIGLIQANAGDADAAIATMRLISEDAGVTRGLRERAQTLIVALGGEVTAPTPAE